MENDNTVLLNPPLFALDKDAPLRYAGDGGWRMEGWVGQREVVGRAESRGGEGCPGRESYKEVGKWPWKVEDKIGSRSQKGYLEGVG